MSNKYDPKEDIKRGKDFIDNLRKNLPDHIEPLMVSIKSKLPFKATSLREALFHRITDLGDIALKLYDENRIVPAFIITRAVIETFALLYKLYKEVKSVIDSGRINEIDDFLMRAIFGYRNTKELRKPIHISTLIDLVDQEYKGFERDYSLMCEFTHPNWSGVHGSYSMIDLDKKIIELGAGIRGIPVKAGIMPLFISLELFQDYYNKLGELLPVFVEVCDSSLK